MHIYCIYINVLYLPTYLEYNEFATLVRPRYDLNEIWMIMKKRKMLNKYKQ